MLQLRLEVRDSFIAAGNFPPQLCHLLAPVCGAVGARQGQAALQDFTCERHDQRHGVLLGSGAL